MQSFAISMMCLRRWATAQFNQNLFYSSDFPFSIKNRPENLKAVCDRNNTMEYFNSVLGSTGKKKKSYVPLNSLPYITALVFWPST